ncbi:alpha/beta fold hydrolase [Nocardioides lijunqiniae]|uniref:alpha/beta fold hydrolase n=1 Tax=Nocardioides lijunqiniae TaxID=2760832 RepID=UPI001878F645|nr:alpha/beta hydrolase [Nocardioides lijunqiniae]
MDIILIAGLWLDGSAWDDVVPGLTSRGHRPVALTLPGQGDGASATLDDQAAAVVAAVDAAEGRPLVVGHSGASTLAWIAADARPERVAAAALVGGFPGADGEAYFGHLEPRDGVLAFPGWEPFEGPDTADLDANARRRMEAVVVDVPEAVVTGVVRLADERRYDVPVVMVCPEYSPDEARAWVASGDLPELARATHVEYVDLDSGHWPMYSRPAELADALATIADGLS